MGGAHFVYGFCPAAPSEIARFVIHAPQGAKSLVKKSQGASSESVEAAAINGVFMGKNIRVLLVRHGESMGNIDLTLYRRLPDHRIPLSPKGEEQAIEAGKAIRRFYEAKKPRHIRLWTSPYMRMRQTADGILAGAGNGLIADTREHINLCEQQFGAFDGIPEEELPARFPDAWTRYKLLE